MNLSKCLGHISNFIYFRRPSGLWFRTTFILYCKRNISRKHPFLTFMTFVSMHKHFAPNFHYRNAKKSGFVRSHSFILGIFSGMAAVGPSVGMRYVDPTPIASHTVSAEAIESEYAI